MPSKKPENFSWTVEGLLAGSAIPWEPAHFQYYLDHNIKTLVTLTEFKPPMHHAPPGLQHIFLPIVEFEAPSIPEMEKFTDIVLDVKAKGEAVCVHCHWGRGRTGTMLAAYLVAYCGFEPRQAIGAVRQTRPYSIETYEQEEAVFDFAEYMQMKRQHGGKNSEGKDLQNGETNSDVLKETPVANGEKDRTSKPGTSNGMKE